MQGENNRINQKQPLSEFISHSHIDSGVRSGTPKNLMVASYKEEERKKEKTNGILGNEYYVNVQCCDITIESSRIE
jgi:hypothetical protein